MANVVQMGVDAFWRSLQDLQGKARAEIAQLNADKMRLQQAWSATKQDHDTQRAAQHQAILQPLIHANSKARLDYAGLVAKFNQAVNAAAGVLRQAGLNAPNLSGPELVILVPVVAVTALGVAWAIYANVHAQTAQQTKLIDSAMAIFNDPNATAAERQQAAQTIAKMAGQKPPGSDPFNLNALLPIAAIVAAIVILPPLLERMPRVRARRSAA